ncbi:MAG: hypothetical protein AAFN41_10660 [Planctomycetota bacterium]
MPTGLALIAISALSLGYAVLDDPAMDPRKPLWVLGAERFVFGEARDARTFAEVKRRFDAVPSDPAEQQALGQFALSRAASPGSDLIWHGLTVRAIRSQWVDTESASAMAQTLLPAMLRPNASDEAVLVAAAETYFPHANLGWPEMIPMIDRVASMSRAAADAAQGTQTRFAWLRSPERRILSAWAESAWPMLSIEQRNLLTGSESAVYTIEVPRRVVAGEGLPYRINTRRQPLITTPTLGLWSTKQWGSLRINGTDLTRSSARFPAGWTQHGGTHNDDNSGRGTTTMIPVPTDQLGVAEVIAEIRPAYHVGNDPALLRDTVEQWPRVTMTTQTEVLPAGTEAPEPEVASAETISAVLDCLGLRFEWIEDSPASNDPRLEVNAMFKAPAIAIDHWLVLVQDGVEFQCGLKVNFDAGVGGSGYNMWVWTESSRQRVWGSPNTPDVRIDPGREFQLALVPDEFSVWSDGIVSQRIPLGTYLISRQDEVDQSLAGDMFEELPARTLTVIPPDELRDERE